MIVTCEECTTSFQLDEARIPPGGARVRCSRCKHAFFLPNPNEAETPAMDPVHAIAEDAAADAVAGTPSPSADLNDDTWDGLGGAPVQLGDTNSGMTAPTEPVAEPPASEPDLEDEEEWQFSEEVRIEGDDDLEDDFGEDFGGEPEGELDFGGGQDFSEGFDASALSVEADDPSIEMPAVDEPEIANAEIDDPGADSGLDLDGTTAPPVAAAATAATSEAPVRDESSFGSVDDFSSLMEDDEPGGDAVANLASEIASELDTGEAESGLYASNGQSDDLGDPESWDLVGSDDYAAPRAAAGTPASAALNAPVEEEAFFNDDTFEDVPDELDLSAMPLAAGPVGRAAGVVGWIAAAAATIAVAVVATQAEWARISPSLQAVSAGPVTAETLSSGWVETARSGMLLRFEGEVRNTGTKPMLVSGVTIALLDAAGERIDSAPTLHAGIPLPEAALRESAPDVLARTTAAASRRFARTPIAPGESVRFEALVTEHDLPESASRALLEVEEPTAARPAPPVASGQPIAEGHAPTGAAGATGAPAQEGPQAERSSP